MMTVRLEGRFGFWGQKNAQNKFRRCNLMRKGSGLLDEQSYLTSWEKDHREREVTKKLGEIIMERDNILLIIQRIDMVYGSARLTTTVTAFFNPWSTCSLV